MYINDVFKNVNAQIDKNKLTNITRENFEEMKTIYTGVLHNYDDVSQAFISRGLNPENLYYCDNKISPFWYIDGYAYVEVYIADNDLEDILNFFKVKDKVDYINKSLSILWDEGNYESFYALINTNFSFSYYLEHFNELPEEHIYPIFIMLYVNNDYGFRDIPKDIIRKIFLSKQKYFEIESLNEYNLPVDSDGNVIVYRGMASESTPISEAYSWTIDINTALSFAVRFDTKDAKIYKATIPMEKIIDFIEEPEHEVLLLPEDLVSPKIRFALSISDILQRPDFFEHKELWDYMQGQIDILSNEYLTGIHGISHIKRVTLLTIIYSYLSKLEYSDMEALAWAGVWHDIGRTDDSEDEFHGIASIRKLKQLRKKDNSKLSKDTMTIIKEVVSNHCKDDMIGINAILNNSEIQDKDRALFLYKAFKDCDNLDRVRLKDLDLTYLRNSVSIEMVLLAGQLLRAYR